MLIEAYQRVQNRVGLTILLTSLNMSDEYTSRFTEVLAVSSVGTLARNRGTTAEEQSNLAPYKMVDPKSSMYLFDIFSPLVNESTEPGIDRLLSPNATLTDAHFSDICRAFPGTTAQDHGPLMFALATLFVKYSSQPFFGTAADSPVAIRCYANALLNKFQALSPDLFHQIQGGNIREELLKDACTDILSSSMREKAKSNSALKKAYEEITPQMWQ